MNRPGPFGQEEQPGFLDRLQHYANVIALVTGVFATFAKVALFRKGFGERYFHGWKTGLVLPLLLFFPIFWPMHDPTPLLGCLLLYVLMCIVHRLGIYRRRRRGGPQVHSYYNGISRLERHLAAHSEEDLKGKHEPSVMLCFGLAALIFSQPLGWFFICCAVSMAVQAGLLAGNRRTRSLDLADARIDGQVLATATQEPARAAANRPLDVVTIHGSNA